MMNFWKDGRRRRVRVTSLVVAVATAPLAAGAPAMMSPEAKCLTGKASVAARYATCRQGAEKAQARQPGVCSPTDGRECHVAADCPEAGASCDKDVGPTSAYQRRLLACVARFDAGWEKQEAAAVGACIDGLDPEAVRSAIDDDIDDVAAALAGLGLVDCGAELVACTSTMAACSAERDACRSQLESVNLELEICSGVTAACISNPEAAECTPPDPPSRVVATPAASSVEVVWSGVAGADSYRVERGGGPSGPFAFIGRTTSLVFVDRDVVNDTPYWYRVVALREGIRGEPSAPVSVTPTLPPAAATALAANGVEAAVELAWAPGLGAVQTRVWRSASASGAAEAIALVSGGAYRDAAVTNGATYWYSVSSVNLVGESDRTEAVPGMPLAPPAGLTLVPADAAIALFWTPSAGATGYEIERAAAAAGPWTTIGGSATARFSDVGLENGATWFYRVTAIGKLGSSASSQVASASASPDADGLPPAEDPTRNSIGMNVWFNTDWNGYPAFVDAMKQSRIWQDAVDWHQPVAGTDPLGWPTADASTVVYSGPPADFNGTYRLVFEGQASVSVMWTPGSVANKTYDEATNTTTADVTFAMTQDGSTGLVLRNTRRTAQSALGTGFRNLRLYRPGYSEDTTQVFTPEFLTALSKASVVRMHEWLNASSNVVQHWAERVTPAHATQAGIPAPPYAAPDGAVYNSGLGVALEYQILLCNQTHADCWINIPPVADDDFVYKVALALRFGTDGTEPYTSPQPHPVYPPLNPGQRIYLEYSNEIWNSASGFTAFHMIKAICAHLPAGHPVMTPTPDSVYTAMWRYPAWRIHAIAGIFQSVFGEASMLTRVRPLLMTQEGNAQNTLGIALTWFDGFLKTQPGAPAMKDVLYGAGGAAYYGVNSMISADPDQFFAAGNYPHDWFATAAKIDALWSGAYGLQRVAYEGGPGLNFSGADNQALNADPRMADVVESSHDLWSSLGGGLLSYYCLTGPTEWEFTPHIDDTESPKLAALDALNTRPRAPVTMGPALPGSFVVTDPSTPSVRTGYGYRLDIDGVNCEFGFKTGDMYILGAHAPAAVAATLTVNGWSSQNTRVDVWINGERQGEVAIAAQTSGTRYQHPSTPLAVSVPAGRVVVRLEVRQGELAACSVSM